MPPVLTLRLLGELAVLRDGVALPLPPSRKTRALLGYLVMTGRPHRRERLCELFWDLPDDPRGALRWSLSKLRPLVDADAVRIVADRERVEFDSAGATVDIRAIHDQIAADPPLSVLKSIAESLQQPLLDGADLPQCDVYQAWLVSVREDANLLARQVIARILAHPGLHDHDALRWSRVLLTADPLSGQAALMLVKVLRKTGRGRDADDVEASYRAAAFDAGQTPVSFPVLQQTAATQAQESLQPHQKIGFCEGRDSVTIAYATVGQGPPLVKAANWLNHLELDWQSPIWGRTFAALSQHHTLIRYDTRGNGMSDWDVPDISQAAFVRDLESVVDTLGLQRFPLLGMSQGCALSIEYAVRHPERVSALILYGGYAAGWRLEATAEERQRRAAVMTLTRLGWGTSNPAYRHIFSSTFMPDGSADELAWFDEFQRLTTSAENAVRFQDAFGDIDVRHLLAQVRVPTLVLHARDDQRISLDQGRALAVGIPGARFVTLESRNHILLDHEPAWPVFMQEISRFLAEQPG